MDNQFHVCLGSHKQHDFEIWIMFALLMCVSILNASLGVTWRNWVSWEAGRAGQTGKWRAVTDDIATRTAALGGAD